MVTRTHHFNRLAASVAVIGCVAVVLSPLVLASPAKYTGSTIGTGVVAGVFATYTLLLIRENRVSFAASTIVALLGLWLVYSPMAYGVTGWIVGAVQTAGMLISTTSGYLALEAVVPATDD